MTFLGLGLSGLVLLRLLLQMPIVFLVVLPLVMVWFLGMARFRRVRLGGHKVRKVRGNAVDGHDAADIFLYRGSSIAPLLDMRRRFKAVMDVLDSMVSHGVTLSRSVELTAQRGKILSIGPFILSCWMTFMLLRVLVFEISVESLVMFIVVSVISFMVLWFAVGMRLFGGGVIGYGRILWSTLTRGSGLV